MFLAQLETKEEIKKRREFVGKYTIDNMDERLDIRFEIDLPDRRFHFMNAKCEKEKSPLDQFDVLLFVYL